MAAIGALGRLRLGLTTRDLSITSNYPTTYAMAALNTGWCARFTALDTRDIKTVYVNFSAVSVAGVITLRIETIDAATGKPSGTLYDAAATKTLVPSANWNAVTFDTLPTAGLTAGAEYAIVLLTTTGGTTMTLRSHSALATGGYPAIVLTAADGTTRSNFAEVASSIPVATLIFEDDAEEALQFLPFSDSSSIQVYGKIAAGAKYVFSTTVKVSGAEIFYTGRSGTPSDLLVVLRDASNNVLTSRTLDKDSLANTNAKNFFVPFTSVQTLAAGTYRVTIEQSDNSTTSTNRHELNRNTARSTAVMPSGFCRTGTADNTASPITWTDTAADLPGISLVIDDIPAVSGGGMPIIGEGLVY